MKRRKEYKHHSSETKNPPVAEKAFGPDRWKIFGALAVIVLISIIVYLPVFHNGFLAWDDDAYIKNNPLIYSINLKEIFSHNVMGNWHPVTMLALALEYHLFGLNASGYHAVNLLLHLLNVILVFYTVFLLSNKAAVALVASLLFGIHPLHVESVAWAAELKDLLYTFFFLAAYICYLKYLKELRIKNEELRIGNNKYYLLSLLLFAVSLLSKAMAASLPLVLILTDYFKGRKIDSRDAINRVFIEKVPFFLLAIALGVVAVLAQKTDESAQLTTIFTFPQRLVFASFGFITYLYKLLLPLNLSAFYPYPVNNGVDIPIQYYAYLLSFLGLAAYLIYSRRFTKKIIFGIGFFTLTILFVLQLLPVGNAIMADRYSYIPSIGIFYLAGEGFIWLWSKNIKLPALILLSVSSILFSVKTYARCGVWKNDMTLWNDVIGQDKTVAEAYYNRGILFMNEKRNEEAIKDFNKVVELKPGYANSYNGRGVIFTNEKRNDEAIKEFNKAIELNRGYADAYNNRGFLFMNENRNEEAVKDYNKAIELKPGYADAFYNRGSVFVGQRRIEEAIKDFNKAVELKPNYAEAYNIRGSVFVGQRRNEEAIIDFNKAIELKPDYAGAYYNRGIVFVNVKRNEEAFRDFTRAIELKPDYAIAYNNRGVIFVNEKRNEDAIRDFTRAIELNPGYVDAYNNRGFVFGSQKRNSEAIKDFDKAIELKPDFAGSYNNKANLLFEEKRFGEAVSNYTKVIDLNSGYAQAYFKRGLAEFYSGKKAAACTDLEQAVSLGYKPAEEALSQLCK